MSLGRCETCRFAMPADETLLCTRIADGLSAKAKGEEAPPAAIDTSLGEGRLFVLPSFGCVLWEEP